MRPYIRATVEAPETVAGPETVAALDIDIPKHHVKSQTGPDKYLQIETDTFAAVQLAYDEMSEKHASKALKGHFAKAGTTPKRKLVEFKVDFEDLSRFAR